MSKNDKTPKKNDDKPAYLSVSIVFFVTGLVMTLSESTRATGIPFLVLGLTYFILSQGEDKKPPKDQ